MGARMDGTERGVSPVIGVILMVAIVVILAAVAAVFVLDFGDQGLEDSPDVAIDGDFDPRVGPSGQYLNLSVLSGDPIDTEHLRLAVTNAETSGGTDVSLAGQPLDAQAATTLRAGQDVKLNADHFETAAGNPIPSGEHLVLEDATVRLIWEPETDGQSQQSQTIWRWEK